MFYLLTYLAVLVVVVIKNAFKFGASTRIQMTAAKTNAWF